VIIARKSFKTLKSLENAIFKANLIFELKPFGTVLLPQILLIHKSPILRRKVSAIDSLPRIFAHLEILADTSILTTIQEAQVRSKPVDF
jgi:hypothetical protein